MMEEEANGAEQILADASLGQEPDRPPSALAQFRQALARGARLLSGPEPEKAKLFKRGLRLLDRSTSLRLAKPMSVLLTVIFLFGAFTPLLLAMPADALPPPMGDESPSAPAGAPDDFQLGAASANLTVTTSTSKINVWTEEYVIKVDYSTSYVDYRICPYFCTDFVRYRRVNPQYAGDGTYDENGNELTSLSMTISSWGRSGSSVWFIESCPEFSLNQSFRIFRDYFELDVTYKPGTKKVLTTYFIGLYSSGDSLYNLVNTGSGRFNRYLPGFAEDTPDGYGLGGWYPSFKMFAPACDLRAPGRNLGVEWGYNETVAYLYSPVWMKDCGIGGASVMSLKFSSKNSIVPRVSLGEVETFHMFCRPYKYSDGKDRGYDVGYAQWVAPKIASAWGNHNTPIFPLAVMDLGTWTSGFRSYVEGSQIKLATYSNSPDQIDWNYKSSQISNTVPGDPASVPTSWQLYISPSTPMTTAEGRVVCNPVSGPHTQSGTYRWQLINNDPYMSWWTATKGVFWDEINMWTADNRLRSDYQNRADFVYDGYLGLLKDSYSSGYWDYVISNPFTGLLHLSIASDLCLIEGYEPSSTYGTDLKKHVQSTMNFVNQFDATYRPRILVYQNYATGSSSDQEDVYSALLGAAKYGFHVTLLSFDSYDSQLHNLRMAEDMFEAMGCTRDSDARTLTVDTLDLAQSTSLTTGAQMVVIKGGARATITETRGLSSFTITNLHATSNDFDLRVPGSAYYTPGPGASALAAMTYTPDGYAKFSGRVEGEKTATLTRNDNIQVVQHTTGSASVSLAAFGPSADLTVSATGGTTALTLKGFVPGQSYEVLVNSVSVCQVTAASDGSITFTRTYGASDRVTTRPCSAPDTFNPHVASCIPADGAASVPANSQVRITFNESMDRSATQAAFGLSGGALVSGSFSWEDADRVLVFTPASPLAYASPYTVQVTTAAKDLAGNALASPWSSGFLTESEPVVLDPPSAPLSLTATGGAKGVALAWQAPAHDGGSPVTQYKVYRGTSPSSLAIIATLGPVTSHADSGLADGTTYYYEVSAVNAIGEGAMSAVASGTTFSAPAAPSSISALGGTGSAAISWSAPASDGGSPITGYRLYRGPSASSLTLLASLGQVLSYADAGLADGTTYYYKVSAVNAIGEGAMSMAASATTSSITPSQPLDLAASPSGESICLSWSAPASDGGSPITGYQVYRGQSSGQLAPLASVGSQLSFVDHAVANGVTYYYQVAAVNSAGEGARSNEVQASSVPQVPSAPIQLSALASDGQTQLSWQSPSCDGGSAIIAYKIYRAQGTDAMSLLAVIPAGLGFLDSGLTNGVTYRYAVSAMNSVGEGAPSYEVSARPLGLPSAPMGLQVQPGNGMATLFWQAPSSDGGSAITGYRVYRGGSASSMAEMAVVGAVTTYVDGGLTNGQTIYYAVAALSPLGTGALSASVSCAPGFVPSAPSSLIARASDSRVDLEWSAPVFDNGYAVTGYIVYRGTAPDDLVPLASPGLALEYADTMVSNGQTYHYRVTATNAMGESGPSSQVSARPATVPGAPTLLVADGGVARVSLTWQAPLHDGGDPVAGYAIYRGGSPGALSQIATVATNGYVDEDLQPSTTYHYEVRAFNSQGSGDAISASAATLGAPSGPTGLAASTTSGSVLLSWSAPAQDGGSSVTAYRVHRGSSPEGMALLATVPAQLSYLDDGLPPGVTYYYAVSAVNAVGEGPISGPLTASTAFTAPSAPPNLLCQQEGGGIALHWDAPSSDGGTAVTGYRVYRGTSPGHLTFLAGAASADYLDLDVVAGTTYHYQVAAVNAVGEGNVAPEVSTMVVVLPSAPSNLQAIKGKNSATLTWDAPGQDGGAAITSYAIYRGTSPSELTRLTTVSSKLSFVDTSLPKGLNAYYRVTAINSAGESQASNEASVPLSKKASPPMSPAISPQDGKILLSWGAPEDDGGENITGYAVYRHEPDGAISHLGVVNTTSMLDMGLTNGLGYSYSIAALTSLGEGEMANSSTAIPFGLPGSPPTLIAVPYDGMVLLQWDRPSTDGGAEISAYDIFMLSDGEERLIGQVTGLMNTYMCYGLTNGNEYVFKVAAVNAAGRSPTLTVSGIPASVNMGGSIDAGALLGGVPLTTLLAAGAVAGLSLGLLAWRRGRGRARASPPARKKAGQAPPPAQAASAPVVRAKVAVRPMATAPARPSKSTEEMAFERTLKDLEVTGRIW